MKVLDSNFPLLILPACGTNSKGVAFPTDEAATRGRSNPESTQEEALIPSGECLYGKAAVEGNVLVYTDCRPPIRL